MDTALHLSFPSYLKRQVCEAARAVSGSVVMGTNGKQECVYWSKPPPETRLWECLNDGTFAQSQRAAIMTTGGHNTKAECVVACGSSHWSCMQSPDYGPEYAGANVRSCVQCT
jgi:hypothetical protein